MRDISWSIEDLLMLKEAIAGRSMEGREKRLLRDIETIWKEYYRTHKRLWRQATKAGTSRVNLDPRRIHLEFR